MARADLDKVQKLAKRSKQARADLRAAIVKARESGETLADIGEAAGISYQRVAQIIAEEE